MSPQRSRDIPASTIAQYIEQGEIPVQHFGARVRRADTPVMNVIYHLIRKTYTEARWREYQGADGAWKARLVQGDALPNLNIVVSANPEMARMAQDDLQAWTQFVAAPPAAREFIARRLNIPISEVRKLQEAEQMEANAMAEQQARAAFNGGGIPGNSRAPANRLPVPF